MSQPVNHLYEFGPFRLDATERLLLRDEHHIHLPPKALETLLVLVENGGHVIDKDELIKKVWPDTFVEEVNLAKDPAGRLELVEKTGMLSFPQIVIDGEVIGGFQELVQADLSGRLAGLTARAA